MTRPVIIGAGGNGLRAIMAYLATLPDLAARVDLHLSAPVARQRPPIAVDLLARCAVLLEEAAPQQGSATLGDAERANLPADCATLRLPPLRLPFLWPLRDEAPPGHTNPAAEDRIAQAIIRAEPDPARRRARYDATRLAEVVNLARSHEIEASGAFLREQGCDVTVAAFVLSRFRADRLFLGHDQPAGALLLHVLAQLHAHPALRALTRRPYDELVRAAEAWCRAATGEPETPIHPEVAAHFGLAWWHRDHRYLWHGQAITWDAWIDLLLRDAPTAMPAAGKPAATGRHMTIGPTLAALRAADRLAGAVELHPAAEVRRVPPFIATTIDPAIAPLGAALLSQDSARYQAPATVLGRLDGAVLLGAAGLVLHNDALVGDCLGFLDRYPAGPVVVGLSAGHVVLAPDLLPPRRRLDGRSLAGFGPGWREEGQFQVDSVPRLVAYARLRQRQPDLRLLLPRDAAGTDLLQAIGLLGLSDADIAWIGAAEAVACAELLLLGSASPGTAPPFTREAALALAGMLPLERPGPPLVYLHSALRHGRLANADAVAQALARHGFVAVDVDALGLAQRIALLRHARGVVAAQGPALADIVFCPPGAKVLELVAPAQPRFTTWSLASCCGLDYGYIIGTTVAAGQPPGAEVHAVALPMLDHAAGLIAGHADSRR